MGGSDSVSAVIKKPSIASCKGSNYYHGFLDINYDYDHKINRV